MGDSTLENRFPDMRPIKSAPTLHTINGCGTSIYGSRDYDPETRTYVKTQFFCFLFVPLIALAAYRVADASRGWYFIGRVPLSRLAKRWNYLFLSGVISVAAFFAWQAYSNSPEYIAGRKLAEGAKLAASGQVVKAAELYREVAQGNTKHAAEAMDKLHALLDGPIHQAPPADVAGVLKVAVALREKPGAVPDLPNRALQLADKHAEIDPAGALVVLDAVVSVAPREALLTARRQQLLERLVASQPDDPELASKLALVYEAEDKMDACEKLLTPHEKRLGTSEGARILGQIYTRKDKFAEACTLLQPYAEGRLQQLHAAETAYQNAYETTQKEIIAELKAHKASGFDYKRLESAGEVQGRAMAQEYVNSRMKDNPAIKEAEEAVLRESHVVPVALDLGIALLRRGQELKDPKERQLALRKAEDTFLAVRGQAGKTDQYRLFMGQVYYWLGKHSEGRKLFDELLEAKKRDSEALVGVATQLREVGMDSEARVLAEEAYNKETDQYKKYDAAALRSLIRVDLDDEIAWLRKTDPSDQHGQASLNMSLGNKEIQEGKDIEAAGHLRRAIELYAKLAQTAATLNNGALAYFSLYGITGEREALDKGAEMLDRAISLKPGDSILISNSADSVLAVAARDIIGASIDIKTLKISGSLGLVSFLYQDRAGRDGYIQRIRNHAGVGRARNYYDRLRVLAPKNPRGYHALLSLYRQTRDLESLTALRKQIEATDLDLADQTRDMRDTYAGKNDEKHRKESKVAVEHQEQTFALVRNDKHGPTFAIAATWLAGAKMAIDTPDQRVNADEIVALAEEAHAAAPSAATHSFLTTALLFRAGQTVATQQPAYREMASRSKRSLGTSYLLAIAISRDVKLKEAFLADADFKRAITLLLETRSKFPDQVSVWSWAMVRAAHPDEAAAMAEVIQANPLLEVERAIELRLNPLDANTAFQVYWAMQIAGKEAEGLEALKKCAAQGVPMPFDVR